jgi:hypothetical protein
MFLRTSFGVRLTPFLLKNRTISWSGESTARTPRCSRCAVPMNRMHPIVSIMAEACVDLALDGKTLGAAKCRYHARAAREDEKKAHMFLRTLFGVRLTPFLLKHRFEHNLLVWRKYGEDSQDAVAL